MQQGAGMVSCQELYATYGMAAEAAQALETEAGNVALAFAALFRGTDALDDSQRQFYSALVDDVNSRTLGNLLGKIKQLGHLDQKILDIINDALERRNYLTHRFFRTHNFAIYSETGRAAMMEELRDIQQRFALARAHLSAISSSLLELAGLPQVDETEFIKTARKLDL